MSTLQSEVAEKFAWRMNLLFFKLDFSTKSLESEIDKILDSRIVPIKGRWKIGWRNHAAIEAYIGEVIVRNFAGEWKGAFCADNPAGNFYTSYVQIGAYIFKPSHFLGYRISNGEDSHGTFRNYYTKTVLPGIQSQSSIS